MKEIIDEIIGEDITEERERVFKEYLLNDEKFKKFLKENYVLVTMQDIKILDLEEENDFELREVVWPMKKEEWEVIEDNEDLREKVRESMKEKLQEENKN